MIYAKPGIIEAAVTLAVVCTLRNTERTLLLEFNHSSDVFGYGADGQLSKRFSQNHITLCSNCIGYWETTSCCEALGTGL